MSIFPIEKREDIRVKMLNIGIQLIREKGMQKITVSEITKLTGIGKGTFYHFYESKERFIYEVIHYSKDKIYQELNQLVEEYGVITRNDFSQVFTKFSMLSKDNIIHDISIEDEQWLAGKLSMNTLRNSEKEIEVITTILTHCTGVRPGVDYLVISNMMKIMAIVAESREYLHEEVLEVNMKLLRDQLLNYVFED